MAPASARVAEDADLGGLEGADELAADDLALLLGVHDPLERVEELVAGVDDVEVVEDGLEVGAHLLGLAEPHHPVVDVHAGQPVADRALHDRGGHRGVDAAGERADRPALADLLADRRDLLLDDVEHRPGLPAAGDVVQEVLEHLLTVLGVQHLRVPLDAGQPALDVLERRHRRPGRRGQHGEPVGRREPRSRRATSRRCAATGTSASSVPGSLTMTGVRPYSRRPVCATSPPRPCAISWKP